jgi:WD40 repeat protein
MASFTKKWRLWTAVAVCLLLAAALHSGFSSRSLWSCNDTGPGQLLEGHRFPVQGLAFAPDGTTLTSVAGLMGSFRGEVEVIVWDVQTGKPGPVRTESFGERRVLTLAPDTRTLATAGSDRLVRLWDPVGWREQARLGQPLPLVCALVFSRDGKLLATADHENKVRIWDALTGQLKSSCQEPSQLVNSLAFAPGGAVLAASSTVGPVYLWDVTSGEERAVFPSQGCPVWALAFSPDDRWLATGDARGIVKVWDVAARSERVSLATSDEKVFLNEVSALVFSPDGRTLAVALGRTVQLWDVATGKRLACLEGHEGKVICLAFSPDGALLASGSYDRTVRIMKILDE